MFANFGIPSTSQRLVNTSEIDWGQTKKHPPPKKKPQKNKKNKALRTLYGMCFCQFDYFCYNSYPTCVFILIQTNPMRRCVNPIVLSHHKHITLSSS